jgi:hypothetical protein
MAKRVRATKKRPTKTAPKKKATTPKKKRKPAPAEPKPKKPKKKPAPKKPAPKSKKPPAKKPKRPKLSQSPEAKRSRKRRRAARDERRARESLEVGELELRKAELAAAERRRAGDERQLLIDALREMRNNGAGIIPLSLELTEAEIGARVAWLVVGRFDCVGEPTYAELDAVFQSWRDDLLLEAQIHPQRLSQIRIVYEDPNSKRGESSSVVSHMGPWEAVISEISFELDPEEEDSLANRYDQTTVPAFYVYFSGYLAHETEISL